MRKLKVLVLGALILFLAASWIIGCTGGGIYDNGGVTPTSTGTSSPEPTDSPTIVPGFSPGKELVTDFVTGETNIFNLMLWGNFVNIPFVNVEKGEDSSGNTIYTYLWSEDVYWVEKNSPGTVKRLTYDRFDAYGGGTDEVEDFGMGLSNPKAFLLARKSNDEDDIENYQDYIFVGDDNASIYRYTRTPDGIDDDQTFTLTTNPEGDIHYMAWASLRDLNTPFDELEEEEEQHREVYFYYVRDQGSDSNVERIESNPLTAQTATSDDLATDLTNPYSIYIYNHWLPNGALDPDTLEEVDTPDEAESFVFITEDTSSPNGRVLMYNVSEWDGESVITPVEIATSEQRPSKMTFVPDIEKYVVINAEEEEEVRYGHSRKPAGYLYWTNYHATSGQVRRARLELNDAETNLEVVETETVAEALGAPYHIIGPDDYLYLWFNYSGDKAISRQSEGQTLVTQPYRYTTWHVYDEKSSSFFKKFYVSSNRAAVDGGNWYEIDVSVFEETGEPLTVGSEGIEQYYEDAVDFPLNGRMEAFFIVDPEDDPAFGKAFKKSLFFNVGYNLESTANDDTGIYILEHNFATEF